MDDWPYSYTIPASFQEADPAELTERIIDALETAGHSSAGEDRPAVALGKLEEDGTRQVYINTEQDPGSLFQNLALASTSKATQAQRDLTQRLQTYLDTPTPTQGQSVAAIKDLIRAVRYVWQTGGESG
jgi:hypothetical protein